MKSAVKKGDLCTPQFSSFHVRCLNHILFKYLVLLFFTFSVVANTRELIIFYTVANPARECCTYYYDGICKVSIHQYPLD